MSPDGPSAEAAASEAASTGAAPRALRIGIAHPYDVGTPGGVDAHVQQLAAELAGRGHHVLRLAPGRRSRATGETVTGRSIGLPFNGSTANIAPTPATAVRAARWVRESRLDVLHVHEPATPSASAFALRAARRAGVPVVATFHASIDRLGRLGPLAPVLRRHLRGIDARIAVSAEAARTQREWLGTECEIIPNGVMLDDLRPAGGVPAPDGADADGATADRTAVDVAAGGRPPDRAGDRAAPSVLFVGRADEPRKGMHLLAAAWPAVLRAHPDARLTVVGPGERAAERLLATHVGDRWAQSAQVLGRVDEEDKIAALQGADVFVAPQTGGESFGIVLVEAMAAGAPVVAADLPAFTAILGTDGNLGRTFRRGDADDLATQVVRTLDAPGEARRRAARAARAAERYDWPIVADRVEDVYRRVTTAGTDR